MITFIVKISFFFLLILVVAPIVFFGLSLFIGKFFRLFLADDSLIIQLKRWMKKDAKKTT